MKTRQRKVFERVVNTSFNKTFRSVNGYDGKCIASGILIKYLSYFQRSIW